MLGSHLTLQFDRLLQPGALNILNWECRAQNTRWGGFANCVASGSQVDVDMATIGPEIGANVAHYLPPPFDVVSLYGVQAPGFTYFPISVV